MTLLLLQVNCRRQMLHGKNCITGCTSHAVKKQSGIGWRQPVCFGIIFYCNNFQQQQPQSINAVVKAIAEKQIDKSVSDKKENEKPIAVVIENKKEDVKQIHKTAMRKIALIPEQKVATANSKQ